MPRKRKGRVYWRNQGGVRRAYADFRDFADVGGGQEALVPEGEHFATTSEEIAEQLSAQRLIELQKLRRNRALSGRSKHATFGKFVEHHLIQKKKSKLWADSLIASHQHRLDRAIEFLEKDEARELESITVEDMQDWAAWLAQQPTSRRDPENPKAFRLMQPGTVRKHLNAVSNLYRRAQSEGYVPAGYNPVAAMLEKPRGEADEAGWLEVHDAALLLESARTVKLRREDVAAPMIYPLIATLLLTGARLKEVLGLRVSDISFDRRIIHIRPHRLRRRVKTRTSIRVVPLWPQLEQILREYVFNREAPLGELLFPGRKPKKRGEEVPLGDFRKTLDRVAERAGWKAGEIRTKMFRHTYCAARLQTLDRGHPVALYTVSSELGHGSETMVRRVYAHLGEVRHRSKVVEFRVEQHREILGERLTVMATRR